MTKDCNCHKKLMEKIVVDIEAFRELKHDAIEWREQFNTLYPANMTIDDSTFEGSAYILINNLLDLLGFVDIEDELEKEGE